jgi:aryl-alcohol dehydrogenase-like predicted oxidoreductase
LNIVDARFRPYLPILRRKGIEIHARSVFLQGLLLTGRIVKIENPVETCLGYVLAQDVDYVVVGVNSEEELERLAQVKPLDIEPIKHEWIDLRTWRGTP